jgi:feruloyl esterase
MLQNVTANPLDLDVDRLRSRYEQLSGWLDSTDPDLSDFREEGGKLIVAVGTDDTIAPSGEQLDYYQSVLDEMGRRAVDSFARFYVLPQTGHGLSGRTAAIDGDGKAVEGKAIPSTFDRFALLQRWVEEDIAPGKSEVVTGAAGSLPLCSYPEYPRYLGGDAAQAVSYRCTAPEFDR